MAGKTFEDAFKNQVANQSFMLMHHMYDDFISDSDYYDLIECEEQLPYDSIRLFSYHMQQLMSELGEVFDSDKRWKNFRNSKLDPEGKLEEIADCFIVLMNVSMFSGFSCDDVVSAVNDKIDTVRKRIEDK